ncbi:hypothetical protein CR513_45321, partial [Mucuna pruriens]
MRDKSFSFDPTQMEYASYYSQVSPTELWHKRLGYCHLERILNMKKKEMFRGLPILLNNFPNCNACQFGKQNKNSFPKSTDEPPIRSKRLLSDIYQRCNVAICEPTSCEEALKHPKWKDLNAYCIKKQDIVAQSIAKTEFIAATVAKNKIEIFVDNQATITIENNSQSGEVNLVYCKFEDQLADMFTKSLLVNKFELLKKKLECAVPKARR